MFVKGVLTGEVKSHGQIVANFGDMAQIDAPRPRTPEEVSSLIGSVSEELEKINQRIPGTKFETSARLGGGAATLVDVYRLQWCQSEWKEKITRKVGELSAVGLLGCWRGLQAPGTWACLDVGAGILQTPDILLGAILEGLEICFFQSTAYIYYRLPHRYSSWQSQIENEQNKILEALFPKLIKPRFEINLKIEEIKKDYLNEMSCILSSEPTNGSVEVIFLIKPLLIGGSWQVCDGELDGQGKTLNRNVHLICNRPNKCPVMFQLCDNGVDVNAPIIPLSGEAFDFCINDKVKSVLRALNWV